jgi:hypothetical protein
MANERIPLPAPSSLEKPIGTRELSQLSHRELFKHVIETGRELAMKEVELARSEVRSDIKSEVSMAKGLGVGAVCGLCALNMMLVAIAMALSHVMDEWLAALIVAAVVLAVGTVVGWVGWNKRVTSPLESTRRSLKEDARWAKERLT